MFSYFLRGALHSEKNSFSCYVYLFLAQSTGAFYNKHHCRQFQLTEKGMKRNRL